MKTSARKRTHPSSPLVKYDLYQTILRFGVAVGALLTFSVGALANWDKVRDWCNRHFHPKAEIEVSYARLFGAVQVPAIMYWSGTSLGSDSVYNNLNFAKPLRAWHDENNPLRDAEFAIGPVGSQIRQSFASLLSQPRNLRGPLLSVALTNDPLHGNSYLYLDRWAPPQMDEASIASVENRFPPVIPGNPRYEDVREYLDGLMRRTGFLFLLVKNTSLEQLTDVQLRYQISRMPALGSESWLTNDSIKPAASAGGPWSVDSMYFPNLAPGKVYLLAIAVYNANDGGYPYAFRSSVMYPLELSWVDQGTRKILPIRKPGLEKAARVAVPMGWSQQ